MNCARATIIKPTIAYIRVFLAPDTLLLSPPDVMYLKPPNMTIITATTPTNTENIEMTLAARLVNDVVELLLSQVVVFEPTLLPWQMLSVIDVADAIAGTSPGASIVKPVIVTKIYLLIFWIIYITFLKYS